MRAVLKEVDYTEIVQDLCHSSTPDTKCPAEYGVPRMTSRAILIAVAVVLCATLLWLLYDVHNLNRAVASLGDGLGNKVTSLDRKAASIESTVGTIAARMTALNGSLLLLSENLYRLDGRQAEIFDLIRSLHPSGRDRYRIDEFEKRVARRRIYSSTAFGSPLPRDLNPSAKASDVVPGAIALSIGSSRGRSLLPVLSMKHGQVIVSSPGRENDHVYWTIGIEHDLGYRTYYARLESSIVKIGQRVERGQQIGIARAASPVCLRVWFTEPGSVTPSNPLPLLPPFEKVEGQK